MKELEDKIEGILELHLRAEYGAVIDGTVKASEHLAQEVKEIAIEFAINVDTYAVRNGANKWTKGTGSNIERFTSEELFDQFIKERYKTK